MSFRVYGEKRARLSSADPLSALERGHPRVIRPRSRRTRHSENGWRSVPLSATLARLERFFLTSEMEAEFRVLARPAGRPGRAILKHLAGSDRRNDRVSCGKGLSAGQALVSACVELLERHCAAQGRDGVLHQAPYARVGGMAIDPRRFVTDANRPFDPDAKIDWIWGYSLTRSMPALVPANLVFFPYEPRRGSRVLVWTDSNGLGAGNNLEEAVLHGLIEVIERDAVMIAEYNRLPHSEIAPEALPETCSPTLDLLATEGYRWSFMAVPTDWPLPVVAAFLARKDDSRERSVAFGCHLGRAQAVERALTEAIQMLPPSVNHAGWLRSGSADRYLRRSARHVRYSELADHPANDLRRSIEKCVEVLEHAGSEVIVVDLSLPHIPFPTVRVLATALQPVLRKGCKRLSARFFEVPVRLGFRSRPLSSTGIQVWPLCGYR